MKNFFIFFVAFIFGISGFSLYLAEVAESQTTQPAPPDAQTALAQLTTAVNALTAQNAQLQTQLTAANATSAKAGYIPPGTDLAPYFAGAAGEYSCVPNANYICTNGPANKTNQIWHGNNATINFIPVAGGSGTALILAAPGTVLDGFGFATKPGFPAGIIRIGFAVNYRTGGAPTAPGFPNYFGQGNVIRNCVYAASMGGTYIYGGATGTVIENNYFHKIGACAVYDCGYQTTVLHNQFPEGSQGEHGLRTETDDSMGLALTATQSVVAFNWWDNRTSPPKKEDMTFRQGNGNVVVGNVSLGWDSLGEQNTTNGKPYGSPSYWLGNIFPNAHGAGATVQANINTTIYFDGNYLTANPLASMLTVYHAGNMVTTDSNKLINPPPGAKPLYAAIPGQGGFSGAVVALKNAWPPATQPATQP